MSEAFKAKMSQARAKQGREGKYTSAVARVSAKKREKKDESTKRI